MTTPDPQPRSVPATPEDAGPQDSYGAPDLDEVGGAGNAQPFPQAEPTAEAPTGTYELDPGEPYAPYSASESARAASTPVTPAADVTPAPVGEPEAPTSSEAAAAAEVGDVQDAPVAPPPPVAGSAQPATQPQPTAYGPPPGATPPAGSYAPPAGAYPPPAGSYAPSAGAYPPPPGPYGAPAPGYPPIDPYAKSRVVAGVLGILVGGLGIHRFYLGYTSIGVIQIVVTVLTCGVGAIWGFVEGILYLTQRTGQYSVDATGRPLRD